MQTGIKQVALTLQSALASLPGMVIAPKQRQPHTIAMHASYERPAHPQEVRSTAMVLEENVRKFLEQRRFAVLATINRDGTPQLSVMWYQLQADRIMMNTAASRVKEKNIKADPRISICIEDEYDYVTLTGRAELDYDHERSQADIRALAARYDGEEVAERLMRNTFSKQKRVTIYMTLEHVDSHL